MSLYGTIDDQVTACEMLNHRVAVLRWAWEGAAREYDSREHSEKFCLFASFLFEQIERDVAELNKIGLAQLERENESRRGKPIAA